MSRSITFSTSAFLSTNSSSVSIWSCTCSRYQATTSLRFKPSLLPCSASIHTFKWLELYLDTVLIKMDWYYSCLRNKVGHVRLCSHHIFTQFAATHNKIQRGHFLSFCCHRHNELQNINLYVIMKSVYKKTATRAVQPPDCFQIFKLETPIMNNSCTFSVVFPSVYNFNSQKIISTTSFASVYPIWYHVPPLVLLYC